MTAADAPDAPGGRRPGPYVPPTERLNRFVLIGLGSLGVAVGVFVLLVGAGVLGTGAAHRAPLEAGTRGFAASHGWFWLVVGIGAGVLAALALTWLFAQVRPKGCRDLRVTEDAFGGVHLSAAALTDAVEADAVAIDGVQAAHAVLRGRRDLLLQVTVNVAVPAQARDTVDDVRGEVLGRARNALCRPGLRAQVDVRPMVGTRRRVDTRARRGPHPRVDARTCDDALARDGAGFLRSGDRAWGDRAGGDRAGGDRAGEEPRPFVGARPGRPPAERTDPVGNRHTR